MQDHKRDKVYPLTVEAKVERLVFALAKIKEMEDKLDAIAACYERMREALEKISNDGIERSRDPRTLIAKDALAATPKQSLAAIKSKTLREVAAKLEDQAFARSDGSFHDAAVFVQQEADEIEKGES